MVTQALGSLAVYAESLAGSGGLKGMISAVWEGDLDRLQELRENGTSPDSRDGEGIPALALAASTGNVAIVKALLDGGADVHARKSTSTGEGAGVPVVWYASAHGSAKTLRLILQAGADPNTADRRGITPLMAAAYSGNVDTIPVLLEAKANLEARDRERRTALAWAADGGRYEAARLLLDAGAAVDALGELMSSPLMYAAQHGFDDVIALLIERGADVNRKAAPGLTALDLARQNGKTLTVQLLENGGRQEQPAPKFLVFRSFLYPEAPLEEVALSVEAESKEREVARQHALRGEIREAREILEVEHEKLQGQGGYLWTLAYLQQKMGDRTAALASLREILATRDIGSREELRVWARIRDLGEPPPLGLSRRVLGVVVEAGLGVSVVIVAAYADGQCRFFLSWGGGVIGEDWTDDEKEKAQEMVRLAQGLAAKMEPAEGTEHRDLPKPGRAHFTFLTPGGSFQGEDSVAFLNRWSGRYADLFHASNELFGMLY